RSYLAPETDQLLDFRTLKAMSKLRAANAELAFDRADVLTALRREVAAAAQYEQVKAVVGALDANSSGVRLLLRALTEAWSERRECAFRLLGLLYPPDGMRNCYTAITSASVKDRANALEWLEHHT